MKRQMSKKRIPHVLGLALVLCIGALVISVGTAYARYRDERQVKLEFQVREPERVLLGTMVVEEEDGGETFQPLDTANNETLVWEIDPDTGIYTLQFAVANGEAETSYSTRDQAIRLNVIASLGIAQEPATAEEEGNTENQETTEAQTLSEEENLPKVTVTFVPQRGSGEEREVQARAAQIVKGTALYHTFGEGWLFSFYETVGDEERELTWELSGGKLSHIVLTVEMEGEFSQNTYFLQPLVAAEPLDD